MINGLKLTLSFKKLFISHFKKNLDTFTREKREKETRIIILKKKSGVFNNVRMTSRVVLNASIISIFEKSILNGFF